jgi:UDP-N-acetylglucosamine 2-epimerase (non-hydrolysing)/GDP/UDP-N,N'-diacetylbacillosamine 2-epimerase (hydrolysing)
LTTCEQSSLHLLQMGETENRIIEVGEPVLDVIREMDFISTADLTRDLNLDVDAPFILATQHPVTTEADDSGRQMIETLEALGAVGVPTVLTYPNNDAGSGEMIRVIESYRAHAKLCIVPHLGSRRYLSLLRAAAVLVGNSSSGIIEAPSFKCPTVNVGTRQHGRTRANNVIDAHYDRDDIASAIHRALNDQVFRSKLPSCVNPYGDGHAADRTVILLRDLSITPGLITKWMKSGETFLPTTPRNPWSVKQR